MPLNVLFIGGTGQISLPCVSQALAAGHKVTVFNRGKANDGLPKGVEAVAGDMNAADGYAALGKRSFDVVCQFMVFTPEQMARDIAAFAGRTGQYIFISSASVYQKPARHYVITEETPAENPYWEYSQRKIACEKLVREAARLPWTIMRPSHTVRTGLPTMMNEGDIVAHRMLRGSHVIVCGDGTSPWTLTRSTDFAAPFIRLFGKKEALGETFHITSDRGYLWNDIYAMLGALLGVEAKIVNVPTATLTRYHPAWEGPLLGDKTWTALFDNSKVKRVAGPFTCSEKLDEVLAESVMHFKTRLKAKGAQTGELDPLLDRIAAEQSALGAAD
jgi:nucleoside-diphosphate-sugar epimerase